MLFLKVRVYTQREGPIRAAVRTKKSKQIHNWWEGGQEEPRGLRKWEGEGSFVPILPHPLEVGGSGKVVKESWNPGRERQTCG